MHALFLILSPVLSMGWNIFARDKKFSNMCSLRSGPMRHVSNEPRQVRKEAAVVMRSVCCGVPGLFFGLLTKKYNFTSLACLNIC